MIMNRRSVLAGMAAGGGLLLGGCSENPPTYGNLLRMGDWFTYNAQRLMIPRGVLAREYDRSQITSTVGVGTVNPGNDHEPAFNAVAGPQWAQMVGNDFKDFGGRGGAPGPLFARCADAVQGAHPDHPPYV